MKFKQLHLACLVILTAVAVSAQVGIMTTKDLTLTETHDAKFSVGDVWDYRTRVGEERSRVTIVRLDLSSDGTIVHVAVDDIRLMNCNHGAEPGNVPHMPFAREAFESSVTTKVYSGHTLPSGWKDGYAEWKNAFLAGKAGLFAISIAEAVGVIEKSFQHGSGCDGAL